MVYEVPFFYTLRKFCLIVKGQRQKQMLKISERMLFYMKMYGLVVKVCVLSKRAQLIRESESII